MMSGFDVDFLVFQNCAVLGKDRDVYENVAREYRTRIANLSPPQPPGLSYIIERT